MAQPAVLSRTHVLEFNDEEGKSNVFPVCRCIEADGTTSYRRTGAPLPGELVAVQAGDSVCLTQRAANGVASITPAHDVDRRSAFHEAGHVVVALAQGVRVTASRISDTGGGGTAVSGIGSCRPETTHGRRIARKHVRVALAGFAAGHLADGRTISAAILLEMAPLFSCNRTTGDWGLLWEVGRRAVLIPAEEASRQDDRLLAYMGRQLLWTGTALQDRWPLVVAVAARLIDERELSGAELRSIVAEPVSHLVSGRV